MNTAVVWCKKILIYGIGLLLCAMGVSLSVLSGLGVSPVSSFPYVISLIVGIDLGTCITIVYCVFILLQFILLRRQLHIVNVLQIACSAVFGLFVNLTTVWVSYLGTPTSYMMSLLLLLCSIVLIAVGVTMYMDAGVMLLPGEGLMKAIAIVAKLKTSTAKIIFDVSLVTLAIILSFIFLGQLDGLREGTIITAFCVGASMKVAGKLLHKPIELFINGKQQEIIDSSEVDSNQAE